MSVGHCHCLPVPPVLAGHLLSPLLDRQLPAIIASLKSFESPDTSDFDHFIYIHLAVPPCAASIASIYGG